jgi:hypothetical protein
MLRLVSGAALLLSAYSTTIAAADEVQINEHTLCHAAIHAFDANDLPMIQEILRFVHNVFDDLDAQYKKDEGERALSITLSDKNEGPIVLGYCRQHPAATIHEQVAHLYRAMRSLRSPLGHDDVGAPLQKQQRNEGPSRFKQ